MPCSSLAQREPQQGKSRFPLKIPCKMINALTSCACLGFAQALQLSDPHARMVVAARGDALFGLVDLCLYRCEACQRLAMHLSML